MTIKHNQQIQYNHFRKDWQRRVRCHFDQPGRKLRRRDARKAKAAAVAPRPIDRLRPIVRCPTLKYNRRQRLGRGFSLAELKAAGLPRQLAPTVGIAVDPRRANLSEEGLAENVALLKDYMSRLILFPKKSGQTRKGDADKGQLKTVTTTQIVSKHRKLGGVPLPSATAVREIKKSEVPKDEGGAYRKLRIAKSDARLIGVRAMRAKKKAEEAETKKK